MNKRRIEEMIIRAMEFLNQDNNGIVNSGKIKSEYNGYIASFGPTVIQSGLVQTLAFYSRDDGEAKERKKILNFMHKTLINAKYLSKESADKTLYDYVWKKDESERIRLKGLILECAVACKLAMRTFPKDESKGN